MVDTLRFKGRVEYSNDSRTNKNLRTIRLHLLLSFYQWYLPRKVFTRLTNFERQYFLPDHGASISRKSILFRSDGRDVYPGCVRDASIASLSFDEYVNSRLPSYSLISRIYARFVSYLLSLFELERRREKLLKARCIGERSKERGSAKSRYTGDL